MKSFSNRTTAELKEFIARSHIWFAGALLLLMGGLGLGSMLGNSAIVDEVAHIPAAYSYIRYADYRLNPEHPPLIKDLAGLPLQFMELKFPDNLAPWVSDINGQWEAGWYFIYHLGNDADAILFWSRLPILLLALGFGAVLYWFALRRWGIGVALLILFFYALSPNFIAHSTFVTTDLGASVFIFLAIVGFANYIDRPSRQTFALMALGLAGAQLAKFSSFLLYPLLGVLTLALIWIVPKPKSAWHRLKVYTGGFIGASAASMVLVWLYYVPQTWRMPLDVQDRLIVGSVSAQGVTFMADFLTGLNNLPLMKPFVQYLLGLSMVFGRVAGGNVTYFNGEVTSGSFHWYFPELFLLKTQVPLLLLLIVVVVATLMRSARGKRVAKRLAAHIRTHVLEWTLGAFGLFYFGISVAGNLNLGIRHILPVYLPLFILVSIGIMRKLRESLTASYALPAAAGLVALLGWYGMSTVVAYPGYLSYFNEIIGGPSNSGKYFSDSSVDWGQDLKRLKTYVQDHPEINHIAVDYFGGGVPAYYFCDRKYDAGGKLIMSAAGYDCSRSVYEEWHAQYGRYTGEYIAVSETFLENDRYYAEKHDRPGYEYLRQREPIAKIGNSIYLFKL